MQHKQDIRNFSYQQLQDYIVDHGEKKFRSQQIFQWLWQKGVTEFGEMTNLSKATRAFLYENFELDAVKTAKTKVSSDETRKVLFRTKDDLLIEGVLIPSHKRVTACISTQVGCPLNCRFCATAKMGFTRNLFAGEIFDQINILNHLAEETHENHLSNIVVMGMGEPLLNYDNTLLALDNLTHKQGWGMSPKRITISTVGIVPKIKQLADKGANYQLAVSLHSGNQATREKIVPAAKKYPLKELAEALVYFHEKTNIRITFEYLLLKGINDTENEVKALAEFCKYVPCKINVIDYNPNELSPYETTNPLIRREFIEYLSSKNIVVNYRHSRGQDIDAACGQLANKSK